jgi:hypothetical protein
MDRNENTTQIRGFGSSEYRSELNHAHDGDVPI